MKRIAPALSLMAALSLLPFGATAQDTQTDGETPVGGALALGQELGPQVGQIYAQESHGDWQIRCVKAPEGQTDPCQLFQRMADQEGNPTADMNFFVPPQGSGVAGGATMLAPLRTLLTEGVILAVDGDAPRRYPFSFCDDQGCYSRLGFTDADMAAFRAGNTATVQLIPALAPDQVVSLTLSLKGFTAGMQALGATIPDVPLRQVQPSVPSLGDNN